MTMKAPLHREVPVTTLRAEEEKVLAAASRIKDRSKPVRLGVVAGFDGSSAALPKCRCQRDICPTCSERPRLKLRTDIICGTARTPGCGKTPKQTGTPVRERAAEYVCERCLMYAADLAAWEAEQPETALASPSQTIKTKKEKNDESAHATRATLATQRNARSRRSDQPRLVSDGGSSRQNARSEEGDRRPVDRLGASRNPARAGRDRASRTFGGRLA